MDQESLAAMKVKDVDILSHGGRMNISPGRECGGGVCLSVAIIRNPEE